MAFKREYIENSYSNTGQTSSPLDNEKNAKDLQDSKTSDSYEVTEKYNSDAELSTEKIDTGAFIPKDMTVKLVRADSSNWEIFISSFYALTLTLFGIFLGFWVSAAQQEDISFSVLEKFATLFFLFCSVILIIVWIIIKVKQRKGGIKIPHNLIEKFGEE